MKDNSTLDRRDFFKTGLQVTAGAVAIGAAAGATAAPTDKSIKLTGKIPERTFGKTGHKLPVLGHGGSAMSTQWAPAYNVKLEDEETRAQMVRHAYDKGLRYFDTARVYGESESIMGKGLKDVRDNVYIATKVAMPAQGARRSVEQSLEQLGTDYIDCMQIHSPAIERVGAEGGMKIYEELAKMKEEGLIRFIGVTTHVVFETVYTMIDTGVFDQVLLARGYIRKGMDMMLSNANIEWRERCMARAHELDMGIVIMKVMGLNIMGRGGNAVVAEYDPAKRNALPGAAIRWVLQDERVSMLNIGMSVMDDVDANMKIITGDTALTEDDQKLLADYSALVYKSSYVNGLKTV
ncbi:MAG: aldo/keto reductase [Candidatus Hydrogenedentota bacterium]